MFRITYEDTSFNEWEQALTALLQYEFKCPVQAEWQLFGKEVDGVLERPTVTGNGTDQEQETLRKIASVQKASLGVYERAKLTARQEDTFEDPEVQASEWDRVNSRLYTILMTLYGVGGVRVHDQMVDKTLRCSMQIGGVCCKS